MSHSSAPHGESTAPLGVARAPQHCAASSSADSLLPLPEHLTTMMAFPSPSSGLCSDTRPDLTTLFKVSEPPPSQTQYSPSLSPGFLTSRSDILYIVTYLFCSLFSQVELNRNRGWVCFIHCVPPTPPRPEQCLPHGRYSVNIKRMDK